MRHRSARSIHSIHGRRRAPRRIAATVFAFAMMVPIVAQALVAETPTPTDSPDHGLGEFGRVNDVAVVGNVAYLAGNFSSVGGASRSNLAAVNITTGQVTNWNPDVNGPVLEIEPSPDGATLYIGGSFTRVDGQTRNRVAAVTTSTGNVTGWNPGASGEVRDLEVTADTVYVAGAFGNIGGSGVSFLAAVNRSNGNVDAGWDPSPASSVTATDLSPNGSTLYLGGGFDFVGGQPRPHLAAVSTASGSVTGWSTTTPHRVIDVDTALDGSLVYAAVGGPQAEGGNLATAYSASSGGAPVWSRSSDGDFQAVAAAPDAVYWGGHFVWSQGITRERLMAMDPETGAVLDWNPGTNSGWGVFSLTYDANRLFVGGDFTIAGGITQPHFAMFEETGPVGPIGPTAAFTWSCSLLSCDFDGSNSSDPDGFITNWDWTFADAGSAVGSTPSHTFSGPGSYSVELTVTDNEGLTDAVTQTVTVSDQPGSGIAFVDAQSAAGNATSLDVSIPSAAATGDALLLFASANGNDMSISAPAGWTLLSSVVSSSMTTNAWYRVTQPTDPGASVTVSMTERQKIDVVLAAYTGTAGDPVATFATAAQTTVQFGHTTPVISVGTNGTRIVSYWANKTGGATSWTAPAGEIVRHEGYGSGGGRITALLTDGGSNVATGTYGGLTATSNDDGAKATMWSIALAPSGPPPANQSPTAAFTSSCTSLSCTFNGTGSSDPDGTIVAWNWDFGDGTTGTGETPNHTYTTADTFTVELIVTDNDGATHTTTDTVTTTDPPAGTPIEFRGLTEFSGNVSVVDTTIPGAAQTGDALVMFVTMNGSNQTLTPPAGWTELASQADQSMETRVYLRVAQAGDAGSDVTLGLSAWRKTVVVIAAYGGVDSGDPVATLVSASESGNTASHVTPTAAVAVDGSFVLSYWADKTSGTTSWTAPAAVTARVVVTTSGGGRVTALFGDLGPVPPGSYGGLTGTASSSGGKATMFTIILTPAP